MVDADDSYGSRAFWDDRYASSASTAFDWLQDADALLPLLLPLCRGRARVLQLGCGNSTLAQRLWESGVADVLSLDFSLPAIDWARRHVAPGRPGLRFEQADCCALRLAPSSFELAVDKGCLDSMLCAAGGERGVAAMVGAVAASLAPAGAYVVVSHRPPAERGVLLLHPALAGWRRDVWLLPKPALVGGELHTPPAVRWSPGAGRDGGGDDTCWHYACVLTAPSEAERAGDAGALLAGLGSLGVR